MASTIGDNVKITIFGQSHGEAIGVVMDGLPAGEAVDLAELQAFLNRRAPGRDALATQRREADIPEILSGLVNGRTCGAPLCAVIRNTDARSGDYADIGDVPRPGHADYPAQMRYKGHADLRGGGYFSGRLTAPLCIAGGIARQMLARRGVFVGAHIHAIGEIEDEPLDVLNTGVEELLAPGKKSFPVLDDNAGKMMHTMIRAVAERKDSVGGVVECCAIGLPPGLGDPMFGGVENRLSAMLFAIPGLRGLSFGMGFASARLYGSQSNDQYVMREGAVRTTKNHHGGILGGMTTGMPLHLRAGFRPTPSIAQAQRTVRLSTGEETEITIQGRHDPCYVPRAVPCVEAAVAVVLLDLLCGGTI